MNHHAEGPKSSKLAAKEGRVKVKSKMHSRSLGIFVETFATQIKLLRELVSELALGMFHDRKMEGGFVTLNEFNELSFDSLAPSLHEKADQNRIHSSPIIKTYRMIRVERKGKDRVLHFLDPRFSLLNSQRGRESQVSFRDGASIRALDVSTSVSFWSVGGGRTACPLFQVATGAAHLNEERAGSRDRTVKIAEVSKEAEKSHGK